MALSEGELLAMLGDICCQSCGERQCWLMMVVRLMKRKEQNKKELNPEVKICENWHPGT